MSTDIFRVNLKKLRLKAKLSQDNLSRLANMPTTTYVKIETGINKNPSLESVIMIADALQVSIDKLLARKF